MASKVPNVSRSGSAKATNQHKKKDRHTYRQPTSCRLSLVVCLVSNDNDVAVVGAVAARGKNLLPR